MCSNSRQASGGMPVCKGECPGGNVLSYKRYGRGQTNSDIAVLLRMWVIGQDPWMDVDWKFQDHWNAVYASVYVKFYINI